MTKREPCVGGSMNVEDEVEVVAIVFNPLSENPTPTAVRAVKRFGVIGLIGLAICTAAIRWLSRAAVATRQDGVVSRILTGLMIVFVLVALIAGALAGWHTPAPPHVSAYCAGSDRANPWCVR